MFNRYLGVSPGSDLRLLQILAEKLHGKTFLHINSTREGGGVAEILQRMIPILLALGINARWETIEGDAPFFDITKKIHNALQGSDDGITDEQWQYHYEINKSNAQRLNLESDAVLIHDPQPVPLIEYRSAGIWMWRCHIDLSSPGQGVFDYLTRYFEKYNAAVFSVARFAKALSVKEFIIPPSIDPLSEKNRDLSDIEISETFDKFGIPRDRPIILQVSRFDRFKDPLGVIRAFRIIRKYNESVLVLAGSPAADDPEGDIVLREVQEYAAGDPDIYILLLPPYSDKDINALQRGATVILQKSLREGFGLTVSEAMWKGKPVIGGAVGGIPLQIVHGMTGFLVHSVDGAAFRIRQLINHPDMAITMGKAGREYVRKNFLITRQIRDYLALWFCLENGVENLIEL